MRSMMWVPVVAGWGNGVTISIGVLSVTTYTVYFVEQVRRN
jgi:hypothetical protein